jgi:hypothetical protein
VRPELRPTPVHVRQFAYLSDGRAGRETFRVPPWGYLEGFEVMFPDPIPMLDPRDYFEVTIEAHVNGQPAGAFKVHTLHRNVDVTR